VTPKRVLHVMNGAAGGAFLSTLTLIDALGREGIESSAVCHPVGSAESRNALREATSGRIIFRPLYWWNRKIRAKRWKRPAIEALQLARTGAALGSTWSVARAAHVFRANLIHTNSIVITEGARTARILGAPHVWHLRELVGRGQPFRFPREGGRLARYICDRASIVVATSHNAAASFGREAGRVVVVYNGIDVSLFGRDGRGNSRTVVAMVGNITSQLKRHDLFIEAASRISHEGVEFRVYGDSPDARPQDRYAARMQRLARTCALEGRLRWMGHHPPEAIMRDVDILVHPGSSESFGRTVVEAMAAGVPVVGVDAGGVAELVEDGRTGLLVPPADIDALRDAITKLVKDPDLCARLGRAGRERAERDFSIRAYTRGILDVYATAMAAPLQRGLPT
jgi:glycosyltransferase involved in cell wall biosynthesis